MANPQLRQRAARAKVAHPQLRQTLQMEPARAKDAIPPIHGTMPPIPTIPPTHGALLLQLAKPIGPTPTHGAMIHGAGMIGPTHGGGTTTTAVIGTTTTTMVTGVDGFILGKMTGTTTTTVTGVDGFILGEIFNLLWSMCYWTAVAETWQLKPSWIPQWRQLINWAN